MLFAEVAHSCQVQMPLWMRPGISWSSRNAPPPLSISLMLFSPAFCTFLPMTTSWQNTAGCPSRPLGSNSTILFWNWTCDTAPYWRPMSRAGEVFFGKACISRCWCKSSMKEKKTLRRDSKKARKNVETRKKLDRNKQIEARTSQCQCWNSLCVSDPLTR